MSDTIAVAVFSTLFGFSLPYLANIWDRITRARRIVSALDRELSEVLKEIEQKLAWVGRDVSGHLDSVDRERVVESKSVSLYLGEREDFVVLRAFWKSKYAEIAEAINDRNFSEFYGMHRLVDRFEQKFHEMKVTFDTSSSKRGEMALACFNDLKAISDDLKSRLAGRPCRVCRGILCCLRP